MKVSRYLIAAVIAELIGLLAWFFFCRFGPNDAIVFEHGRRIATKDGHCLNMDVGIGQKFIRLDMEARWLAFQLDFLETSAPLSVGLPAVAVLGLWSWDRRRQQKSTAENST